MCKGSPRDYEIWKKKTNDQNKNTPALASKEKHELKY